MSVCAVANHLSDEMISDFFGGARCFEVVAFARAEILCNNEAALKLLFEVVVHQPGRVGVHDQPEYEILLFHSAAEISERFIYINHLENARAGLVAVEQVGVVGALPFEVIDVCVVLKHGAIFGAFA